MPDEEVVETEAVEGEAEGEAEAPAFVPNPYDQVATVDTSTGGGDITKAVPGLFPEAEFTEEEAEEAEAEGEEAAAEAEDEAEVVEPEVEPEAEAPEAPDGSFPEPEAPAAFDPGDHTIAEVLSHVEAHPDERDAVVAAEKAGKNRSTLLSSLGA